MKIGINGFGRIGRAVFKLCMERGLKVVAINDTHGIEDARYLLQYDSIYGKFEKEIETYEKGLKIGSNKIEVLGEREPEKLPWKRLGVDVVIEATGAFRKKADAERHLKAGAKYVLITAPGNDKPDATIVPGVNHKTLRKENRVISVASCTTNCLVPVVKVLEESFGIQRALMTTVHAYTNDQGLHDASHKKPRRGRAGALNIVPTTTGAAKSVVDVFPGLLGKINGLAVRVPVPVGSLVDLSAELKRDVKVEEINGAFMKAAEKSLKGILEYSEDELVSSDIVGNSHSSIVDGKSTQATGNLVKVLAWYDNEWGYSNRVVDVISMLKKWC